MKRYFCLVGLLPFIAACCHNPPAQIVVPEYHYIVRKAPAELKELPPYPASLPASANQLDLARWIKAAEERQYALEAKQTELIKFYEAPPPAAPAASK